MIYATQQFSSKAAGAIGLMIGGAVLDFIEFPKMAAQGTIERHPEQGASFVTARVIADTGGAFSQSVIVNAGARDGVQKGQAAVTADGLVGRVIDVGSRSARVLLLTDINAKIPVLVDPTRTRAIMAGANQAKPRLTWLPPGAVVSVGDNVVTSGHAGVFPPGLRVGQVSAVGEGGLIIQPYADLSRLEYVRILNFGMSGILQLPQRAAGGDGTRQ